MELSQSAWLLIALALVVGYFLRYFQSKPSEPPLLYDGRRFRAGEEVKIPATGGTVHFEDSAKALFVLQVPQQTRPREIIFTSREPKRLEDIPNPTKKDIYRCMMWLTARDDKGEVHAFDPYITTIAKYNDADLAKAKGDVKELRRYYNDNTAWRELAMPAGARDNKNRTLVAYTGSFSSDAIGGE